MIRYHQLSLPPQEGMNPQESRLKALLALRLGLPVGDLRSLRVVKRSIDARRGVVSVVYTVDVLLQNEKKEAAVIKRFRPNEAVLLPGSSFTEPLSIMEKRLAPWPAERARPLVVGAGPAGLFCALTLAARGARPVLLERGKPVEERVQDIVLLEKEGILSEESNILFGEGGAGAYSDGKLTCGLNSPLIQTVLKTFTDCGAPEEILISAKPHIGTDELRKVLMNMRGRITRLGGEIHFGTKMTELLLKQGQVVGVKAMEAGEEKELLTDRVYLAIGHSARDTYRMLLTSGVPMVQKPFAVGVRIEHLQADISRAQYGQAAEYLPAADYKLNVHTPDERGVYTFCMCPGGRVINASSEPSGINVNGMSFHARDGVNANAALLVGVRPEDFGSEEPLAGIDFQCRMEQAAFALSGSLKAPCQRVEDFLAGRETKRFGKVLPSYLPGVGGGRLEDFLPDFVTENLRYALPLLGRKLRGFDHPDALLTGPETRSSSPVRILRNERMESEIKGLFPLGEGAGYAGGIISAAVDGLKAALEEA